jgi:hypothetical protein
MNDALRDPKVIMAAIAVLNTLVLAIVFQWWRHRKILSYEIASFVPLFTIDRDIKHSVQVLLDGKPAENVHIAIVKITNTGRVPIEEQDFVKPIGISFGPDAEILVGEIAGTDPEDVPATLTAESQSVFLNPLMMNRGDSIIVQVLVSKPESVVTVAGRVKGIPRLKRRSAPASFQNWQRPARSGVLLGVILLVILILLGKIPVEPFFLYFIASVGLVVLSIFSSLFAWLIFTAIRKRD